ncbi:MAG TPA: cobalamin-binding protein [Anaerolineae bacterium]|nr:cobalamin-binding protein [Anaerolineae bacterium]
MSLETIYQAVMTGNADAAASEVRAALDDGLSPGDILNKGCIAAMTEVGRLFEEGEMFVPEMLIAARAMQAAMNILKPYLAEDEIVSLGKVVVGTVAGDLHDIGKNLVGMMMEGAGFEIVDLGTDVQPQDFVQAVREHEPVLVGMSALLTTTMSSMSATIEALTEAGLRDKVKIIVGGAPVTQTFADEIGADGFAPDASSATRKAKELVAG